LLFHQTDEVSRSPFGSETASYFVSSLSLAVLKQFNLLARAIKDAPEGFERN
jgi:hypothetical protein